MIRIENRKKFLTSVFMAALVIVIATITLIVIFINVIDPVYFEGTHTSKDGVFSVKQGVTIYGDSAIRVDDLDGKQKRTELILPYKTTEEIEIFVPKNGSVYLRREGDQ